MSARAWEIVEGSIWCRKLRTKTTRVENFGASESHAVEQEGFGFEALALVLRHSNASAFRLETPAIRCCHLVRSRVIPHVSEMEISWEACQTQLDVLPNQEKSD